VLSLLSCESIFLEGKGFPLNFWIQTILCFSLLSRWDYRHTLPHPDDRVRFLKSEYSGLGGVARAVEHLSSKLEALKSNPSTCKKNISSNITSIPKISI
jgi:hypothetical protein